MKITDINSESMTELIGESVPELYVVLAKHSVMGLEADAIADILGVSIEDIKEVEADSIYKAVRTQVGAAHAESQTTRNFGWNGIEDIAIEALLKRLPFEKDSEFLLRVAAVANKAQRRGGDDVGILEPGRAGTKVIKLTQRMVHRMEHGREVTTESRELSIRDGSMARVDFQEVDDMLQVRNQPVLPQSAKISTRDANPSTEELIDELESRL